MGPVEEEGEPAELGVDDVRVARRGVGRVEAENSVGIGLAAGQSAALGREEDVGGGVEILSARGTGVGGDGLGGELLAALEVPRHEELLGHTHPLVRLPPCGGGGRIHCWVEGGIEEGSVELELGMDLFFFL